MVRCSSFSWTLPIHDWHSKRLCQNGFICHISLFSYLLHIPAVRFQFPTSFWNISVARYNSVYLQIALCQTRRKNKANGNTTINCLLIFLTKSAERNIWDVTFALRDTFMFVYIFSVEFEMFFVILWAILRRPRMFANARWFDVCFRLWVITQHLLGFKFIWWSIGAMGKLLGATFAADKALIYNLPAELVGK